MSARETVRDWGEMSLQRGFLTPPRIDDENITFFLFLKIKLPRFLTENSASHCCKNRETMNFTMGRVASFVFISFFFLMRDGRKKTQVTSPPDARTAQTPPHKSASQVKDNPRHRSHLHQRLREGSLASD